MPVARGQRHGQRVMDSWIGRTTVAITRCSQARALLRGGGTKSSATSAHSRQELAFDAASPPSSFSSSSFLFLPHTTRRHTVFARPLRQQTNTPYLHARPHSGSEFKITKTRDFQTTAGSLCIRPAALNDSQFRTLPSCNPFVYCEDLVATNSPTTEQLHVVD